MVQDCFYVSFQVIRVGLGADDPDIERVDPDKTSRGHAEICRRDLEHVQVRVPNPRRAGMRYHVRHRRRRLFRLFRVLCLRTFCLTTLCNHRLLGRFDRPGRNMPPLYTLTGRNVGTRLTRLE